MFISAIALAAADLVRTEALLKIVHRVLSITIAVAAIVAHRKGITVLLKLVIRCHLSFTFRFLQ